MYSNVLLYFITCFLTSNHTIDIILYKLWWRNLAIKRIIDINYYFTIPFSEYLTPFKKWWKNDEHWADPGFQHLHDWLNHYML